MWSYAAKLVPRLAAQTAGGGIFMKVDSLETLLQEEVKDIYDAEKRLVKAIPKMAKAASSEELRSALTEHLEVTKGQVQRLEEVFDLLGTPAKGTPCAGMKGLIEECDEVLQQNIEDNLMDAAIIGAAQRVEHYEMAAYGTARTMAERIGNSQVADLLEETLNEEKEADLKLTEVAEQLYEIMGERSGEAAQEPMQMPARKAGGRTRTSRA
jgi:ferritin-like metal-binding protein YciE